jgi:hypothetical protein
MGSVNLLHVTHIDLTRLPLTTIVAADRRLAAFNKTSETMGSD